MKAAKDGVGGHITSWTTAQLDGPDLRGQVTAGWFGTQWVCFALAVLLCMVGRHYPIVTGGFPLGYMMPTMYKGLHSYDFYDGLHAYVQSFAGRVSPQTLVLAEDEARDTLMAAFAGLSLALMVVAGAAVLFAVLKPAKKKARKARAYGYARR